MLNAANYGVVVLVNDITRSVILVGLAIIAFTLPAIPFSAIAGVMVDRLNKRQVLWISNLLRMVTMLLMVISLLAARTSLWPLFALTFMAALIGQFFTPAEGAAIPLLVGERDLMPALSLFNITVTLAQAIGFLLLGRAITSIFPPFSLHLGALVLQVQPIDMLFVVAAALYALCALLILFIPKQAFHEDHAHALENIGSQTKLKEALKDLWRDLVEGWEIVRRDRLLFFSVIELSVAGILMLLIGEVAGPFVQQVLHRPAQDISIILAPAGVGLVGASILMPHVTRQVGKTRLIAIGLIVLAVGFFLLIASQWLASYLDPRDGTQAPLLLWITMALVLFLGIAMACVNIPSQTMMQEHAPEEGRARVLALQFMLYNVGAIPVLLFAGAFAQYVGFNQLVLLLSSSLLLFWWWGIYYVRKKQAHKEK